MQLLVKTVPYKRIYNLLKTHAGFISIETSTNIMSEDDRHEIMHVIIDLFASQKDRMPGYQPFAPHLSTTEHIYELLIYVN